MKDFEVNDGLTGDYSPERLRPENLREQLKLQGIDVTPEQAVQLVELLDCFSTIIISQHLRQCK
jgi:hypothetical protein